MQNFKTCSPSAIFALANEKMKENWGKNPPKHGKLPNPEIYSFLHCGIIWKGTF